MRRAAQTRPPPPCRPSALSLAATFRDRFDLNSAATSESSASRCDDNNNSSTNTTIGHRHDRQQLQQQQQQHQHRRTPLLASSAYLPSCGHRVRRAHHHSFGFSHHVVTSSAVAVSQQQRRGAAASSSSAAGGVSPNSASSPSHSHRLPSPEAITAAVGVTLQRRRAEAFAVANAQRARHLSDSAAASDAVAYAADTVRIGGNGGVLFRRPAPLHASNNAISLNNAEGSNSWRHRQLASSAAYRSSGAGAGARKARLRLRVLSQMARRTTGASAAAGPFAQSPPQRTISPTIPFVTHLSVATEPSQVTRAEGGRRGGSHRRFEFYVPDDAATGFSPFNGMLFNSSYANAAANSSHAGLMGDEERLRGVASIPAPATFLPESGATADAAAAVASEAVLSAAAEARSLLMRQGEDFLGVWGVRAAAPTTSAPSAPPAAEESTDLGGSPTTLGAAEGEALRQQDPPSSLGARLSAHITAFGLTSSATTASSSPSQRSNGLATPTPTSTSTTTYEVTVAKAKVAAGRALRVAAAEGKPYAVTSSPAARARQLAAAEASAAEASLVSSIASPKTEDSNISSREARAAAAADPLPPHRFIPSPTASLRKNEGATVSNASFAFSAADAFAPPLRHATEGCGGGAGIADGADAASSRSGSAHSTAFHTRGQVMGRRLIRRRVITSNAGAEATVGGGRGGGEGEGTVAVAARLPPPIRPLAVSTSFSLSHYNLPGSNATRPPTYFEASATRISHLPLGKHTAAEAELQRVRAEEVGKALREGAEGVESCEVGGDAEGSSSDAAAASPSSPASSLPPSHSEWYGGKGTHCDYGVVADGASPAAAAVAASAQLSLNGSSSPYRSSSSSLSLGGNGGIGIVDTPMPALLIEATTNVDMVSWVADHVLALEAAEAEAMGSSGPTPSTASTSAAYVAALGPSAAAAIPRPPTSLFAVDCTSVYTFLATHIVPHVLAHASALRSSYDAARGAQFGRQRLLLSEARAKGEDGAASEVLGDVSDAEVWATMSPPTPHDLLPLSGPSVQLLAAAIRSAYPSFLMRTLLAERLQYGRNGAEDADLEGAVGDPESVMSPSFLQQQQQEEHQQKQQFQEEGEEDGSQQHHHYHQRQQQGEHARAFAEEAGVDSRVADSLNKGMYSFRHIRPERSRVKADLLRNDPMPPPSSLNSAAAISDGASPDGVSGEAMGEAAAATDDEDGPILDTNELPGGDSGGPAEGSNASSSSPEQIDGQRLVVEDHSVKDIGQYYKTYLVALASASSASAAASSVSSSGSDQQQQHSPATGLLRLVPSTAPLLEAYRTFHRAAAERDFLIASAARTWAWREGLRRVLARDLSGRLLEQRLLSAAILASEGQHSTAPSPALSVPSSATVAATSSKSTLQNGAATFQMPPLANVLHGSADDAADLSALAATSEMTEASTVSPSSGDGCSPASVLPSLLGSVTPSVAARLANPLNLAEVYATTKPQQQQADSVDVGGRVAAKTPSSLAFPSFTASLAELATSEAFQPSDSRAVGPADGLPYARTVATNLGAGASEEPWGRPPATVFQQVVRSALASPDLFSAVAPSPQLPPMPRAHGNALMPSAKGRPFPNAFADRTLAMEAARRMAKEAAEAEWSALMARQRQRRAKERMLAERKRGRRGGAVGGGGEALSAASLADRRGRQFDAAFAAPEEAAAENETSAVSSLSSSSSQKLNHAGRRSSSHLPAANDGASSTTTANSSHEERKGGLTARVGGALAAALASAGLGEAGPESVLSPEVLEALATLEALDSLGGVGGGGIGDAADANGIGLSEAADSSSSSPSSLAFSAKNNTFSLSHADAAAAAGWRAASGSDAAETYHSLMASMSQLMATAKIEAAQRRLRRRTDAERAAAGTFPSSSALQSLESDVAADPLLAEEAVGSFASPATIAKTVRGALAAEEARRAKAVRGRVRALEEQWLATLTSQLEALDTNDEGEMGEGGVFDEIKKKTEAASSSPVASTSQGTEQRRFTPWPDFHADADSELFPTASEGLFSFSKKERGFGAAEEEGHEGDLLAEFRRRLDASKKDGPHSTTADEAGHSSPPPPSHSSAVRAAFGSSPSAHQPFSRPIASEKEASSRNANAGKGGALVFFGEAYAAAASRLLSKKK